jgi:hypothetical protein
MQTGVRTRANTKLQLCPAQAVEARDAPICAHDVLKDRKAFATFARAQPREIRNSEHADKVTGANDPTFNVLEAS